MSFVMRPKRLFHSLLPTNSSELTYKGEAYSPFFIENKDMYRLLAIDLDGTLLNRDSQISERKIEREIHCQYSLSKTRDHYYEIMS